jgi:hypothetical protein
MAAIPRVVAAQFGVVPLAALPDGGLEVAAVPGAMPASIAALGRALGRRVVATAFDESVVHFFLSRVYLREESLNFHTFARDDFLADDREIPRLLEEKPMEPVPAEALADPDALVLLDYAYRSVLEPLDARPPVVFDGEAATDLAFVVPPERPGRAAPPPDARPTLSRDADLPGSVLILARESFSAAGAEHKHGWRRHEVERLPFMIHPSELQVTGLAEDGSLGFFVYDRIERVRPGETPRFDVTYHFLSMGQRLRRRLVLKVYGLWLVRRDRLARTPDALAWDAEHFRRWLGYDLA